MKQHALVTFIGVLLITAFGVSASIGAANASVDCSQRFPGVPFPSKGAGNLRVVTINTDGASGGDWDNSQRTVHLNMLSDLIFCLTGDLVSLQEVHRETNYWPNIDMAVTIRTSLNQKGSTVYRLAFQPACKRYQSGAGIEDAGNAILSTSPNIESNYDTGFVNVNRADGFVHAPTGQTFLGGGFDYNTETIDRAVGVMLPTNLTAGDPYAAGWPGGWGEAHARCYTYADDDPATDDTAIRHARLQRVATVGVTHDVLAAAVHLSPRSENDEIRRDELQQLHDQIVGFVNPYYNAVTGRGASREAVVFGDFNENACIFDDRCDTVRNRGFRQIFDTGFAGTGWNNATEGVSDSSLDHIFTKGLTIVRAGKIDVQPSGWQSGQPGGLNHDVIYADIVRPY